MKTITWKAERKTTYGRYTDSTCGRFQISRTAGRRGSENTVLFADGTRGTTAKAYFSLFTSDHGYGQIGNYRTLKEAMEAAEQDLAQHNA